MAEVSDLGEAVRATFTLAPDDAMRMAWPEEFELRFGLPDDLRGDAARLYWLAFGKKLGRILGPDARALQYLEITMRGDHAVVALDRRDQLLGIAGFKSPAGSFAGGTLRDMQGAYGVFGAAWRSW